MTYERETYKHTNIWTYERTEWHRHFLSCSSQLKIPQRYGILHQNFLFISLASLLSLGTLTQLIRCLLKMQAIKCVVVGDVDVGKLWIRIKMIIIHLRHLDLFHKLMPIWCINWAEVIILNLIFQVNILCFRIWYTQ